MVERERFERGERFRLASSRSSRRLTQVYGFGFDFDFLELRTLLLVEPTGGIPNASLLCKLSTFSTALTVRGLTLARFGPGLIAPLLGLIPPLDDTGLMAPCENCDEDAGEADGSL